VQLNVEALSKMKKLKILKIRTDDCGVLGLSIARDNTRTLEWHGDPSNFMISNELCVMEMWRYPFESLPINFQPNNLVELIMPHNYIKQLWDGKKVRFWLMQMYIFFFLLLFFILSVLYNYLLVFYNRVLTN
jgi:hypothetical protein